MRARLALLIIVASLLAPAAAFGQGNAFGPLPQAAPAPTPTPTAAKSTSQDSVGRSTLLLVALGVAVVFVGLGVAITRDARSNLTDDDRAALVRAGPSGARSGQSARRREAPKSKQRQKARPARATRKRTTRTR